MKRLIIRLSLLSIVVVVGLAAIVQAQRDSGSDLSNATPNRMESGSGQEPAEDLAAQQSVDPFAMLPSGSSWDEAPTVEAQEVPDSYEGNSGSESSSEIESNGAALTPREQYESFQSPQASGESASQESGNATTWPSEEVAPLSEDDLGPAAPVPAKYERNPRLYEVASFEGDETPATSDQEEFGSAYETTSAANDTAHENQLPSTSGEEGDRFADQTPRAEQEDEELGRTSPYVASGQAPSAPLETTPGLPAREQTEYDVARRDADKGIPEELTTADNARPLPTYSPETIGQEVDASERGGNWDEGTGLPGSEELEGLQVPSINVEKVVPKEVQVGKETLFQINISNTGTTPLTDLEVVDSVPQGSRLVETRPSATRGASGEIVWHIDTLGPGERKSFDMHVVPISEGEIGSVAHVRFVTQASAKTLVTRPQLLVEVSGPKDVLIGEAVILVIKLSNIGTGVATGVMLEEVIPAQLSHPSGNELELAVGKLAPGESRQIQLSLTAAEAGQVVNHVRAYGDGGLVAKNSWDLEVVAPGIEIVVTGPSRRYLDTQAKHTITVRNPGTAPAKNVEVVAKLSKGLKFIQATNSGQYDPAVHAVYWNLVELPPARSGDVMLMTEPVEAGEQIIQVEGSTASGLSDTVAQNIVVEGLAALLFKVADTEDPVEIGGETIYEIQIVNQGTKDATNVQLAIQIPREMEAIDASGPTRNRIDGQLVIFEPLRTLAPKADAPYRVRVRALEAGDLRIRVQLKSDDLKSPVTKEESTRSYSAD